MVDSGCHRDRGSLVCCDTYHVKTIPGCVASDDVDFLVGVEPNNILVLQVSQMSVGLHLLVTYLKSFLLVGSDASRASAAHNLEINEVNVDGVGLEIV